MAMSPVIKRKVINAASGCLFAATIFYFTYHTVSGRNGILAMMQLTGQVEEARQKLNEIKLERITLEGRVSKLSKTIDRDLLDEESRRLLNHARPDEIIVLRQASETRSQKLETRRQ